MGGGRFPRYTRETRHDQIPNLTTKDPRAFVTFIFPPNGPTPLRSV